MEKEITVKSLVAIPKTLSKWFVVGIGKIKKISLKIMIIWIIKIRGWTISLMYWKKNEAKRGKKK